MDGQRKQNRLPRKLIHTNPDIVTTKLLFNRVISTPHTKFLEIDLKDFYLQTPMEQYTYTTVPRKMLPQTIIDELNLEGLIKNEKILVEIQQGM